MFALQFISNEVFPLKRSDTSDNAIVFMEDWRVSGLPVVEGGKVLGYVRDKMLVNSGDSRVDTLMDQRLDVYCIHEHTHLFDILGTMYRHGLDSMAVVNTDQHYLGTICAKDITTLSYSHSALQQEGSLLVLEIPAVHYSLAEISRICESNEVKIIHLMIETLKDEANTLLVSIKLNQQYLHHVMASFERFGYRIVFSNSPADPHHSMDERFNWLVKYLNT